MRLPTPDTRGDLRLRNNERLRTPVDVVNVKPRADENDVDVVEVGIGSAPGWLREQAYVVLRHATQEGLHLWTGAVRRVADDETFATVVIEHHEIVQRRYRPRIAVERPVELQSLDRPGPVATVRSADLSESGMRLELDSTTLHLTVGQQIMVCLHLPGGMVNAACEVIGLHDQLLRVRFVVMHQVCLDHVRALVAAELLAQHCDLALDTDTDTDAGNDTDLVAEIVANRVA